MYTKSTKVFGILGFPLGHTLSPWIHNTLFSLSKFDGVYLVFENQDWNKLGLSPLENIGAKGLSVTIPFKEWAFSQGKTACPISQSIQASNTLVHSSEIGWQAYNTDGTGAVLAIEEALPGFRKDQTPVLVLGSGGSAKGICFALLEHCRKSPPPLFLLSRNEKAARELQERLASLGFPNVTTINESYALDNRKKFGLVVHTTPVGMQGHSTGSLLPKDFFNSSQTLFDIVYNPMQTEMMRLAKSKKTNLIPGYKMLLYQGIAQFELFTNIFPKKKWIQEIDSLLLKKLKKR